MTSIRTRVLPLLAAVAIAGCDGLNDRGSLPLSSVQPAPMSATPPVETTDAGAAGDPPAGGDAATPTTQPPRSYDEMCRNYCAALEQTQVYACLARGQGDATTCGEKFSETTARCWDLRCVPELVQPSLCITQCDALASVYDAVCAAAPPLAGPPLACVTPAAAHDAACRAGCALDSAVP